MPQRSRENLNFAPDINDIEAVCRDLRLSLCSSEITAADASNRAIPAAVASRTPSEPSIRWPRSEFLLSCAHVAYIQRNR
jgi:hypothetical protein